MCAFARFQGGENWCNNARRNMFPLFWLPATHIISVLFCSSYWCKVATCSLFTCFLNSCNVLWEIVNYNVFFCFGRFNIIVHVGGLQGRWMAHDALHSLQYGYLDTHSRIVQDDECPSMCIAIVQSPKPCVIHQVHVSMYVESSTSGTGPWLIVFSVPSGSLAVFPPSCSNSVITTIVASNFVSLSILTSSQSRCILKFSGSHHNRFEL